MKSYKISFDKSLGWIIEIVHSDFDDKQAISFESHEDVNEFLEEFGHVYQDSLSHDWSF